jgi:threonine-phosphate decarboxylase
MKLDDILKTDRCVHGARVKEYAERLGLKEEEIIDFSSNINPLPFPPQVRELYTELFQAIGRYPDDRYMEFREAAAGFLADGLGSKISADNVIPGNGSVEVLRMALGALLNRGDSALIPIPTFGEYEWQSRLYGAEVRFCSLSGVFNLSNREIAGLKTVFFCNPNNPTGELYDRTLVERLAHACAQAGSFLVIDEAFIELSRPKESAADLAVSLDNLLVLRSLTKCFAMPGLRLGYGVGSKKLIEALDRARLPWNVNVIASSLGSYLLRHGKDFLAESRRFIQREREWLRGRLTELGLEVHPSTANFLLVGIKSTGLTAPELVLRAVRGGVLLRDCSSFRGIDERHIRAAVRSRQDNRKLLEVLAEILGGR